MIEVQSSARTPVRLTMNLRGLLVGERGFEPPAPASRRQCSTRLSYSPTEPESQVRSGRQAAVYRVGVCTWQAPRRDYCRRSEKTLFPEAEARVFRIDYMVREGDPQRGEHPAQEARRADIVSAGTWVAAAMATAQQQEATVAVQRGVHDLAQGQRDLGRLSGESHQA